MTITTVAAEHDGVLSELQRVMGTVVTFDLVVPYGSERQAHLALASACAFLRRVDFVFSLWKPESPMSRIRRGDLSVIDAPAEVAEIVELCAQAREMTRGWFDADALPGGFDPTGIVKGWAAKRATEILVAGGIQDALVNAGGDVSAVGARSARKPWRIGILDPSSRARLLGTVDLTDSIATSGTYERGEHLFDPMARRHRTRLASASVTGSDLAFADALATALVIAGEEGLAFVDAAEGYEALVCDRDGSISTTSGFVWTRLGAGLPV